MPSWDRAAWSRSATPPISAAAPMLAALLGQPMLGAPMLGALIVAAPLGRCRHWLALVIGWFCVRLRGVYFAMLTPRLRPDRLVGGLSSGAKSPAAMTAFSAFGPRPGHQGSAPSFYYLTLGLRHWPASCCLRHMNLHPLRLRRCSAGRDAVRSRAEAIGIDVARQQWLAFVLTGSGRRPCRRPLRLLQGQRLPGRNGHSTLVRRADDGADGRRPDALAGPWTGAASIFTLLHDWLARIAWWRLRSWAAPSSLLVIAFPQRHRRVFAPSRTAQ